MPVSGTLPPPSSKTRVWQTALVNINEDIDDVGQVVDPDPLDFESIVALPAAVAPFNTLPVSLDVGGEEIEADEDLAFKLTYQGNTRLTGSDRGSVIIHVEKQVSGGSTWDIIDSTTFDGYMGRLQNSTPKGTPVLAPLLIQLDSGDKLRFRMGRRAQPHNLTNFRVTLEELNL